MAGLENALRGVFNNEERSAVLRVLVLNRSHATNRVKLAMVVYPAKPMKIIFLTEIAIMRSGRR